MKENKRDPVGIQYFMELIPKLSATAALVKGPIKSILLLAEPDMSSEWQNNMGYQKTEIVNIYIF